MKFRGVMVDAVPMREFMNILSTISKISKECVVRISKNKIMFIVSEESCGKEASLKVWSCLDQTSFFSDFHMEGVDEEHTDILLGLVTANLAGSVAPLKQSAKCFKMKLTNKSYPCLTLVIELSSLNSHHTRQVTHDVPVTVIPRKAWKAYDQPNIERYNITIMMPALKQLKSIVERMKCMSPELIIKANSEGRFVLQIKTDLAVVSSRFKSSRVLEFQDEDKVVEDEDDPRDQSYIICQIDIRKFAMFLSADQIFHSHNMVLCSMLHKQMVALFIQNEGIMSFQCYIPALIT